MDLENKIAEKLHDAEPTCCAPPATKTQALSGSISAGADPTKMMYEVYKS